MHRFAVLLAVLGAVICANAAAVKNTAPLLSCEDAKTRVDGEYIFVLHETVTDKEKERHIAEVKKLLLSSGNSSHLMSNYTINDFKGYSAKLLDDGLRDKIRLMPEVKYVECSQIVHTYQSNADCTNQKGATWGIVRTTYRDKPTVDDYSYNAAAAGENVKVYVIDTGIFTQHPDFEGRAEWGVDFVDSPSPRDDLNGHGTHCAGTVMSKTWGIAKKATAIAVRVLDQNGSGTTKGVIDGINWVADQHSSGAKTVASMSLGGSKSTSLNNAVDSAVSKGVNFAVAAGNEAQDACNTSPASASNCVSVMASDESDQFADFSNYGRCAHIIAPGVDITSTWNNGGTKTISGTSMATPHVAGVMAKYLSSQSTTSSPKEVKDWLINNATPNKINGVPTSRTPNLLLFMDCV